MKTIHIGAPVRPQKRPSRQSTRYQLACNYLLQLPLSLLLFILG